MLFNSWEFAVFLLVVLALYWSLNWRAQNVFLVLASYFFYGWWDWRFLSLLLISTVVDYFASHRIAASETESRRRGYLLLSLGVNLGILGFFKYFNFFAGSLQEAASLFGWGLDSFTLRVLLPVGISFYTFQTMAYTIDVYRGRQAPAKDWLSFGLYVCYFPQLVAGPIERAQHLLPAFENPRSVPRTALRGGVQLMLIGYFKKVAIADAVAPHVNEIFTEPGTFGAPALMLGVILFALQIYGDFSGYSDIARGVSRLLGIELMVNFRQPYLAENITDFWRRWHISLSTWLRDYLYIPLGGNRRGRWRTSINLFITMGLGGLWHGASWNFVIWGLLHGVYLSVHKLWTRFRGEAAPESTLWSRAPARLLTLAAVGVGWVFFRAPTLPTAIQYLTGMLNYTSLQMPSMELVVTTTFYGALVLLLDTPMYRLNNEMLFTDRHSWIVRGLAYAGMIWILVFVGESGARPFIYFQF